MQTTHSKGIIKNLLKIKDAVKKLDSLAHPFRQSVMATIIDLDDEATVTNIFIKLRCDQSVVSQHLGILKRQGFLSNKREGKNIVYSVNLEEVERSNNIVKKVNEPKINRREHHRPLPKSGHFNLYQKVEDSEKAIH